MLDRLVQSLTGAFAFVGVAWSQGGRDEVVVIRTAPEIAADADAMFRTASITKVVIGRVLERVMSDQQIVHPYAFDVRGLMDLPPNPPFYPRPLVGHFGNAYGFTGGVWYDAATDLAFAYALNGRAIGDEADTITSPEQAIFDAIAALKG